MKWRFRVQFFTFLWSFKLDLGSVHILRNSEGRGGFGYFQRGFCYFIKVLGEMGGGGRGGGGGEGRKRGWRTITQHFFHEFYFLNIRACSNITNISHRSLSNTIYSGLKLSREFEAAPRTQLRSSTFSWKCWNSWKFFRNSLGAPGGWGLAGSAIQGADEGGIGSTVGKWARRVRRGQKAQV